LSILEHMNAANAPTRALCQRTMMVEVALDEAKTPSDKAKVVSPGEPYSARQTRLASQLAAAESSAADRAAAGEAPIVDLDKCGKCGREGELKKCARCLSVAYCGRECQTAHWPTHKVHCKKV
jgi:hypothetical protein